MAKQSFATVLVGPSGLLREGLARMLERSNFRIVSSAACVRDLLLKPLPQLRPVVLIIDIDGHDPGLAQIVDFKSTYQNSRVVVLGNHYGSEDVISAFRAGADAYLVKVAPYDAFIKSLELVMLGQTVVPVEILAYIQSNRSDAIYSPEPNSTSADADVATGTRVADRTEEGTNPKSKAASVDTDTRTEVRDAVMLSAREMCILGCLINGESNKTIARKIEIAEATVKVHVKAILCKIRVRNRTQAAVWALNHSDLARPDVEGTSMGENRVIRPSKPVPTLLEAPSGVPFL